MKTRILTGMALIVLAVVSAIALQDATASVVMIPMGLVTIVDAIKGIEY